MINKNRDLRDFRSATSRLKPKLLFFIFFIDVYATASPLSIFPYRSIDMLAMHKDDGPNLGRVGRELY